MTSSSESLESGELESHGDNRLDDFEVDEDVILST